MVQKKPELTLEQKRSRLLSYIFLAIMVIGSVGIDQATKLEAQANLMVHSDPENLKIYRGQRYPLWASRETPPQHDEEVSYLALNFNYVRNQGAAWGIMSDVDDSIRVPFFHIVTIVATLMILFYLKMTPLGHRLARFGLGLILSGAFGNFIDRIWHGYVIDFIDVNWKIFGWRYYFPNFNFADSCITVGVVLLMIDMIYCEGVRRRTLSASQPTAT